MNPSGGDAALIVNAASRRGAKLYARAVDEFDRRGVRLRERHAVRNPATLAALAQGLIGAGVSTLVVGGGDGTLAGVAAAFSGSEATLGILPLGTGNSFAHTLGIPPDLDGAIETILNGRAERVDLGVVNGRMFVNAASIGLSVVVARRTAGALKSVLGPAAYVVTGAIEAWRHRSFRATLELDGVERTLRTQQIIITNGRFFGTTPLGSADQVVSERLLVLGLEGTSPWELARFWAAMLAGHPERMPEVHTHSVRRVHVATRPHRSIELDGEIRVRTPATFSVLPKALRVYVPALDLAADPA